MKKFLLFSAVFLILFATVAQSASVGNLNVNLSIEPKSIDRAIRKECDVHRYLESNRRLYPVS